MVSNNKIKEIIESLKILQEDISIPKNIKSKIKGVIETMQNGEEISIRVNKALNELDEISEDPNIEAYTRTQLWNVVSSLEKLA